MDRSLYISMSGAKESLIAQANNANNLANANTDGFKQDFNEFRAQHVQGPGWRTRAYAMDERPATDFSPGAVKVTGRDLDVMTPQDGFLAIQTPDGQEAYVRSASMQVSPQGDLLDVHGNPMLNEGGTPINLPPFKRIHIGQDGSIGIIPVDSANNIMEQVDQLRLVKPNIKDLTKDLSGFIRYKGQGKLNQDSVTLNSGALETSNVNTAKALIDMIELTRKYEMQIKMMKTTKEDGAKTDSLLRLA